MKNFNTKIFASVTAALMIAGTVVAASAAEYSYQNGRRTLAPDTVSENAGVERDTSAYAWNRGTEQNANREEAYAARPETEDKEVLAEFYAESGLGSIRDETAVETDEVRLNEDYGWYGAAQKNTEMHTVYEELPADADDETRAAFYEATGLGEGSAYDGDGNTDEEALAAYSWNTGRQNYEARYASYSFHNGGAH